MQTVFVMKISKPRRKVILKRGTCAKDYFEYCKEVGCEVWEVLKNFPHGIFEPVCLWLPEKHVLSGTSVYVQGVEVSIDYCGEVPEGFEMIELPAADYLLFVGPPFPDEDYAEAIGNLRKAAEEFDPKRLGWEWDGENPKMQLEPLGKRGYIELWPVKRIGKGEAYGILSVDDGKDNC
ncbi:MAG: hypothetical protein GX482_04150 [Acholeplasmataceae bacterium]|jgi:hypothetical protein|nr:hypothetical protein [Acholeplasmataceae bacterium]